MRRSQIEAWALRVINTIRGGKRVCTHHRIATAGFRLSDRRIPFNVTEEVVNAALGVAFPASAADASDIRVCVEKLRSCLRPAVDDCAITIDKLYIAQLRRELA